MRRVIRRARSHRLLSGIALLVLVGSVAAPMGVEASEASREGSSSVRRDGSSSKPLVVPARAGLAVSPHPCGTQSVATIAAVDARVARQIYAGELTGTETRVDQAHVRSSTSLLSAMASGDPARIFAAVHSIVYTPHWHIVRLRVFKAGHMIADVGGPYVIAPVEGVLRQHGHTVGRYVMSVQDDLGYIKLVSRFIGVPVDLYRGRSFVMGVLRPPPPLPSSGEPVVAGASTYRASVFSAEGFLAGALDVALLNPTPPRSLSSTNCTDVLAYAWGSVAMRIASRLRPLSAHFTDLVGVVTAATRGSVFVVSRGHVIAGGRMPARLPTAGIVRVHGYSRAVFSWLAAPHVRVYVLAPA
jgi:hypothetical protein